MSANFDPYRDWMELEGDFTTPDYYQLFSLPKFESDSEKIASAAARAATKVRSCRPGEHAKEWAALLDEIRTAQKTLSDPAARAAYDQQLGGDSSASPAATPAPEPPPAENEPPPQPSGKFDPMLPPGMGNTNTPSAAEAEEATAKSPERPSSILPKGLSQSVTAGYMPPGADTTAQNSADGSPPANPATFAPPSQPENPAAFAPPADVASTPQLTPLDDPPAGFAGNMSDPMAPAGSPQPPMGQDPMAPAGLTPLGPMDPTGSNPPADNSGLTPLPAADGSGVSNAAMDAALDILSPQNQAGVQPPMGQPVMGQPVMGQPVMGQPVMGQPVAAQPVGNTQQPMAMEQPAAAAPVVRGHATPSQIAAARRKQGLIALVLGVVGLLLVGALVGGLYLAMNGKGKAAADGIATAVDTAVQPDGAPAADGNNPPANPADAATLSTDGEATSADGGTPPADGGVEPRDASAIADGSVPAADGEPQPPADGSVKPPADGAAEPPADGGLQPADDGAEPPPVKPADGAMADGAVTPPPVKPEPVKPVPKPPAPPKPTRAELQKLSELLAGARTALGERDFKTAGTQLGQAFQLAKLPEHKAMASRLQTLSSYATKFWRAVVAALGNIESASIIEVAGQQVAVVESSPQRIIVRYSGRRVEWTPAQIPSGFALPITAYGLPENAPENDAIKAAIYLVDTDKTKWAKARPLLIRANAAGVKDAGILLRTIDDDYASIVRDAK